MHPIIKTKLQLYTNKNQIIKYMPRLWGKVLYLLHGDINTDAAMYSTLLLMSQETNCIQYLFTKIQLRLPV